MQIPYELILGWRYTRAGRTTRRNGFISFISGVSMLGIALGVAALIIVLSVMNGFQKEVRDRMLGVVSHIEIFAPGGAALPDLDRTLSESGENPQVIGAAPFVSAQGLLAYGEDMKATLVRGIDPLREPEVTDLAQSLKGAGLARLVPGEFGIVVGGELARSLGVHQGDKVTLITPSGQVTPAGVVPRLKQMTVVGTFDSGHFEYDSALVLMHMDDAARIYRLEGPTGVRLKLRDLHWILLEDFIDDLVERHFIGYLNQPLLLDDLFRGLAAAIDFGKDLARDFQTDRALLNQLQQTDEPFR